VGLAEDDRGSGEQAEEQHESCLSQGQKHLDILFVFKTAWVA
jgi:hypothetical protein